MSKIMDDITNPNLEFHKQKLAEILESHERGEAKTYTFEEFKSLQDKHIEELRKKYQKKASGQ